MAPDAGLFRRPLLHRRARAVGLDHLCRALGAELWTAGPGAVVSFRPDPACLSHSAAERPLVGDPGNAAIWCRAPLGYRGPSGVPAGAGANCAVLFHHRRDLLADLAGRVVEPAQAHLARPARRHRHGAALPGPLGTGILELLMPPNPSGGVPSA